MRWQWLLAAGVLAALSGCKQANSTVLVNVTVDSAVPPLYSLRVVMSTAQTHDTKIYPAAPSATPLPRETSFVIVVPRSRNGILDLALEGLDSVPASVGHGTTQTTIVVGGNATASVTLVAGPPTCGDGLIEAGESCDDGNQLSFDGCDFQCQAESPPLDAGVPDTTSDSTGQPDLTVDDANTDTPHNLDVAADSNGAGTGGIASTGGTTGAGGTTSAGGTTGAGGRTGSGGTTSAGGTTGAGGRTGSGGTTSAGGTTGAGGRTGSGGTTSTGGTTGAGGTAGSGGTTAGGAEPGAEPGPEPAPEPGTDGGSGAACAFAAPVTGGGPLILNTTGPFCFVTCDGFQYGWGCDSFTETDRSVKVNGIAVSCGGTLPPKKPEGYYYFEIGPGGHTWDAVRWGLGAPASSCPPPPGGFSP